MPNLKWNEAIKQVLEAEGAAMHYVRQSPSG